VDPLLRSRFATKKKGGKEKERKGREEKGEKGKIRRKKGKVNEMRDENGKLKKQISGYGLILSRQMTQL